MENRLGGSTLWETADDSDESIFLVAGLDRRETADDGDESIVFVASSPRKLVAPSKREVA